MNPAQDPFDFIIGKRQKPVDEAQHGVGQRTRDRLLYLEMQEGDAGGGRENLLTEWLSEEKPGEVFCPL